jgi:Ca-activated chloride channel family protein
MLSSFRAFQKSLSSAFTFRVLSCTLLVLFLLSHTSTKVLGQETVDEDDVVRVNTQLLLFPVRIRNRQGLALAGLTEQDLSIKDPDKAAAGLYLSAGADRVALLFALDQSRSLREIISRQRDAASALVTRFGERSSVSVLRFAEKSSITIPFTRDETAAQAGFMTSVGSNERTAIFDAAAESIRAFSQLPTSRSERRLVVLISDGLDNASTTKANDVIAVAQEKRISFYVIHLPLFEPRDGRLKVRTPSKGFKDLAEKTGGKYFLVGDERSALNQTDPDLSPIFKAIEEDLKSQYLLGFYVAESAKDNRRHVLKITLKPEGAEYSLVQLGYARTHEFFVNLPPGANKIPER